MTILKEFYDNIFYNPISKTYELVYKAPKYNYVWTREGSGTGAGSGSKLFTVPINYFGTKSKAKSNTVPTKTKNYIME